MENNKQQTDAINTLRFLSADMVQEANSGHPGLPMGCATIAYTIWTRHLRHNPRNPKWPGRDRFILSAGHGSALLYSLLHLTGYDLSIEELKRFRQFGSLTPGHPEFDLTPGVEVTTGPLGQGFANGVGMAIAGAHLEAIFNTSDLLIFDSHIYSIISDGDLMEGITSEAASIAGHLKLGKLIYFYDDNHISIDGSTELAFTEDRCTRFEAYGWQVIRGIDGDNVEEIDRAINSAKLDSRPSLICCRTIIGHGLPSRQGTNKAHGEPPGNDELDSAKEQAGWPTEPRFYIPVPVFNYFRHAINSGIEIESDWIKCLNTYRAKHPKQFLEIERRLNGKLPDDWYSGLPSFPEDGKGIATRVASGKIINQLSKVLPELMGGSADLAPSTKTWITNSLAFQIASPEGRNFHFGVREHAMGAIINGLAVFGGVIPFGATFLVFSDYMRTPIRLSALSGYPSIWVFTHDSIGVGEDGPTHQPIEHLASLRAIPDIVVVRPSDANETVEAWKVAVSRRKGPTCLILTRQDLPIISRSIYAKAEGLQKGAYILSDTHDGEPDVILMGSGSEVQLLLEVKMKLTDKSIKTRVVSFPSWELFASQNQEYRDSVLPPSIPIRLAVEAGVSQGWDRWTGSRGRIIGIDQFGASAPSNELFNHFGFTVQAITEAALEILRNSA